MNVVLFRDLVQENWQSIEVYANRTIGGLQRLAIPDWSFTSACPPEIRLPRLTVPSLYFNRAIIYPPYARGHQGDINHVVDNSYGYLLHFISPRRTVVTSHGGTPISWRKWNREGPAMRFFDWAFAGTLKAAHIIIVSEYSKCELLAHYSYPQDQIHVVYHGVDECYRVLSPDERAKTRGQLLTSTDDSLILHVGSCITRKNVDVILQSVAHLRHSGIKARLIQVGGTFTPSQIALIEHLKIGEWVTQFAPRPNADLVSLYNAADVFVFPSLYEGFGMPLIEAMTCNTPVVCSDYALFHEVCADAALFANSRDAAAFASAITRLLTDSMLSSDLRVRGIRRAERFSWERAARETLAVYQQIAE